jgi:hypothetical protein
VLCRILLQDILEVEGRTLNVEQMKPNLQRNLVAKEPLRPMEHIFNYFVVKREKKCFLPGMKYRVSYFAYFLYQEVWIF